VTEVWHIEGARDAVGELAQRDDASGRWVVEIARGAPARAHAPDLVVLRVVLEGGAGADASGPERVEELSGAAPRAGRQLGDDARALVVAFDPRRCRAEVDLVRLGRRRWRESFADARDLVLVVAGSTLVVRVSDEEEPYELGTGCALWVESPSAGTELDLVGAGSDARAVLVEVGPARDPNATTGR